MTHAYSFPKWYTKFVLLIAAVLLIIAGLTGWGQKERAARIKHRLPSVSVVLWENTLAYGKVVGYFSNDVVADYQQEAGRRSPATLTLRFYKSGEYQVTFKRTPGEEVVPCKGGLLKTTVTVDKQYPQSTRVHFAKSGWKETPVHAYSDGETEYAPQEMPDNLRVVITRKSDGKTESHDF